jgi:outer membrane receptor protein involved in Fe transport
MSIDSLSYLVSGAYLGSAGNFPFDNNNGTEENENDDFSDFRENNDYTAYSLLFKADYVPSAAYKITAHNEFFTAERGIPGMITFPSPHVRESDLRNSSSLSFEASDLPLAGLTSTTQLSFRYGQNEFTDSYGEMTGAPIDSQRIDYSPAFAENLRFLLGESQVLTLSGEYRIDALNDSEFVERKRYNFALGARNKIFLFDDSLILVPALRYDKISSVGERTSPKLGLAWWVTSWLVAKGNAGSSFRAPALDELYYNHGYVVGNPNLKPETATNYDVGLQVQSDMFFLEGAYYYSKVRNLIEYVLVSGFRYKPFNIGEVSLSGIELSGRFRPIKYFNASGNYTLTYAIDETNEYNRQGNQVPGRPRHKAFLRLEGLIDDFLSPFFEYHYIGSNYVTVANTKLIDQRRLYNCGLLARLGDHFKLGAEIKNLADDRALDVRGFPLPGRSYNINLEIKL